MNYIFTYGQLLFSIFYKILKQYNKKNSIQIIIDVKIYVIYKVYNE